MMPRLSMETISRRLAVFRFLTANAGEPDFRLEFIQRPGKGLQFHLSVKSWWRSSSSTVGIPPMMALRRSEVISGE